METVVKVTTQTLPRTLGISCCQLCWVRLQAGSFHACKFFWKQLLKTFCYVLVHLIEIMQTNEMSKYSNLKHKRRSDHMFKIDVTQGNSTRQTV